MSQGCFITLEGGEGVGKSSNLLFIQQFLEQKNIPLRVTREPGGTPIAEKIRSLLLEKSAEILCDQAELLLVFAARAQHLQEVIQPALHKGDWVLCDRFTDATFAYQGGGRGMNLAFIEYLEQAVQGALRPDLTLLLDAPVEVGMQRAQQRGELDRFETEQRAFFERVRQAYLTRAAQEPGRYCVIDASQSLRQVQQQIAQVLERLCL